MADELPTPEIAEWVRAWRAARQLTYDLLRALPYAVMNFSPHAEFGTLIRQMRHVGDMQASYIAAIKSGRMNFQAQGRQRALEQSKDQVEAYLRHLDEDLLSTLRGLTADQRARPIDWGTSQATLGQHLIWLLRHETLHHGMWIFYARIADLPLPDSWKEAWHLS